LQISFGGFDGVVLLEAAPVEFDVGFAVDETDAPGGFVDGIAMVDFRLDGPEPAAFAGFDGTVFGVDCDS
jgi:hypothetical protein